MITLQQLDTVKHLMLADRKFWQLSKLFLTPLILAFLLAVLLVSNTVLLSEYWIFMADYFWEFAEVAKFVK